MRGKKGAGVTYVNCDLFHSRRGVGGEKKPESF
jgi:hypothetical protein